MKRRFEKRILSLVLCLSMVFTLIITHANFAFSADDELETPQINTENFKNNVGKQAIFDWWPSFDLAPDIDANPDEYNTYDYDELEIAERVFVIADYYSDNDGNHWYKLYASDGMEAPEILKENPWVFYAADGDKENGVDPALCIYEADETIRFVRSLTDPESNYYNYYVIAGPQEIANAEITFTLREDRDFPISNLAYTEGTYNSVLHKAFDITIDKAVGEEVDLWTAEDGVLSIRYETPQHTSDTYDDVCDFGASYMYVDGELFNATIADRFYFYKWTVSSITYTNSGNSLLVFEIMPPSCIYVGEEAYFANDSVTLYDNNMQAAEFLAAQLPVTFTAECSFEYEGENYYWLENKGFIGSPYFIAKAEDVKLGELPEEYSDGRVSITDKMGNSVSEIVLPQYEKPEFTAISSLSKTTADVKYQWQIEYEKGKDGKDSKWVDIYGEDKATIKLSYGMVASLLDDNLSVNFRCETTAGTKTAYSAPISVTLEMYEPKEPDVVVSESFVTSNGETVTVSVAGDIPEDASVALEETDSSGVDVNPGETVVASLDISIKNADGTEWQPESGESVTVNLPASSIGLMEGEDFVVYHLHNGEVRILGTYTVADGTVSFEVDGFSKFVFALASDAINFDYSADIGKHAHLTWSDEVLFEVLDFEPDADFTTLTFAYDVDDFSTDFEIKITDYKVVTQLATTTIQLAEDSVDTPSDTVETRRIYSLWYQFDIVKGNGPEELFNGMWVLQNYLSEEDAFAVDTLTLFDAPVIPDEPEEPAEPSVGITVNGETVNEITVSKSDKVTVTATPNVEGSMTYKWQLLIPAANMWVNISGQTAADCTVNYGMVANRLDSNGQAHIRCVTTINGVEVISESIAVNLVTTYSFFNNYWMPMYLSTPQSRAEGDAPSVSDPVTVTIQFVYGSNPGKLVAEPIRSTIQKGTPYTLLNYKLPEMEGYSAYYEDDTETIWTVIDIELEAVNEDVTITFKYWPAKVNYTVIYYWQNADNDNYTEYERAVLTDFTGNITTVEDKKYDGFYQLLYETVPIASDGSTVIEVYYDRYYYLMLFNLDGGYGVQPVYARHGATLPTLAPKKAGCDFVGWDSDADDDNSVDSDFPKTMPIGDTNYTAIWQYSKDKVDVHIVVWGENPNDEGYSYIKSDTIQVAPGSEINYKENILTCTITEHTHDASCGYNCGKTAHNHQNCQLSCTLSGEAHTHSKGCYYDVGSDASDRAFALPNNPSEGQVHKGLLSSYIYIKGTWYYYNGSLTSGIAPTNCGKTEGSHTHGDSCYTCGQTAHEHSDSCGYACGKNYHKHNNTCYASDDLMDSKLWTLVDSDTVTVAPDGSTIINVYYDRTKFTLTFNYEYKGGNPSITKTITDRWGADISAKYQEIVDAAKTTFWTKDPDGDSGPYTNYFGIMPQANATYYNDDVNGSNGSMQYWGQDFDGNYTINLFTAPNVGGYTVTNEDRYEFEGFTYDHGSQNGSSCSGAKFYYRRNSYKLQFHDNGQNGIINSLTKNVPYKGSLEAYAGITLDTSDAPAKYEPGSVRFAGWYTNPEGAGEPFDFANTTMPAGPNDGDPSLILYAKWVPVTHTVRFYTDKQYVGTDTIYTNSNGDQYIYEIPHGSKIQDPLTPPADPTKGQYKFNGWYYIDAQGNEQRWDFKNTTVTRDVDVYAKWSSNKLMPYTVKFVYVDESGKEIEIADPITGSALGGNSKTFEAKGNEQLKQGYQEGYFPLVQSHTITIDLENTANNEFTFYYVKKNAVPYTVYYVTETPKDGDNLQQIELDGKTYYMVAETKTVSDNKKAIVTETYKSVAGYLPNNYQETLVINPDATTDEPNQIIFIYSVDEKNSMYIVHYYFMDVSGKNYVENPDYLFQSKAEINSDVEAAKLNVDNFTHNPNVIGTALRGKIVKDQILHLHVYYDRNPYSYKVQYLEEGTSKVLSPEKIVTGSLWESLVTEKYITIPNYTLSSDEEVTIQIRKDTENPTVNIITFFYTENKVNLNYVVVGPDGTVDLDGVADFGQVSQNIESVKISSGKAQGSTATTPSSNLYKFVGWYSDAACTNKLSGDAKFVPTKDADKLWINDTTYYAKFEYNLTSLTIVKDGWQNIDPNQTFIFNVKGSNGVDLDVTVHGNGSVTIDGLTVGATYTVTEKTDWSWRYSCTGWVLYDKDGNVTVEGTGNVATITLGLNGTITFTNTRDQKQWLDGDSWCNNIFNTPDNQTK